MSWLRRAWEGRSTWPDASIKIQLCPWRWRLKPRTYYENEPERYHSRPYSDTLDVYAGSLYLSVEWLFVEFTVWWNKPVWTESLESLIQERR